MIKIDASSSLNVRNTWRIDSHVTDELGYGSYSTHIGIVQCGAIHSHALISVSEDRVLVVLTDHPDHSLHHRINHREDSYYILFSDITDIVSRASSDSSALAKKMQRLKVFEKNRQSLHIHLKRHKVCVIDTFDGDFTIKMIISSWQSDLVRRSAAILPLIGGSTARSSTVEYHDETVRCLKTVTRHEELMELLNDLSMELANDLELKDIVFRSKEVVVHCLQIVQDLLSCKAVFSLKEGDIITGGGSLKIMLPHHQDEILPINSNKDKIKSAGRSTRQSIHALVSSGAVGSKKRFGQRGPVTRGDVLSYEEERKLKMVAVRRLVIIDGIYKLFSALVFSSESVSSSFSMIIGPSPMDLQSWMGLLMADTYRLICGALGCLDPSMEEEIAQDIALSMEQQQQDLKLSQRSKESADYDAQYTLTVGTPRRPLSTPRISSESSLVPLSARMRSLTADPPSDHFLRAMHTLSSTRDSVRDLQGVLLGELQRMLCLSKALGRGGGQCEHKQRLSSLVGPAISSGLVELQQVESIGELFVRSVGWEDTLEEMLVRLCSVLEDVVSSAHVLVGPTISRSHYAMGSSHQSIKHGGSLNAGTTRPRTSSDHTGASEAIAPVPPSPSQRGKSSSGGPRSLMMMSLSEATTPRFHTVNANTPRFLLAPTTPRQNPTTPRPVLSITPRDLLHPVVGSSSSVLIDAASSAINTSKPLPPFPKKPNLHALLGSSGALNLQGIAEMSENEYVDSRSGDNNNKAIFSPLATSPLRTQEILLFYFLSLVQHLSRDSHRVREVLRTDLAVHLQTMIAIFNVICPRPTAETLNEYATPSANQSKPPSASAKAKTTESNGSDKADQSKDNSQSKSTSNYVKRFIRMFSTPCNTQRLPIDGGESAGIGGAPTETANKGIDRSSGKHKTSSSMDPATMRHSMPLIYRSAADTPIPSLYLFDYGSPPYELSEASWLLMLLARRMLEDVLVSLGVRPEVITSRPNPLLREAMQSELAAVPAGRIDGIEEGGSDEEDASPRVDPYNDASSDYDNAGSSALNTARSVNDLGGRLALSTAPFELDVTNRWNTLLTNPRPAFTPRLRDPSTAHNHWNRADKEY